jgi:hypothetical protein
MTSPPKRTAVTEIMIAQMEGTMASKNMGSASMAKAFDNNRVTSKKWCCFRIGRITAAYSQLLILVTYLSFFIRGSDSSLDFKIHFIDREISNSKT